MGPGVTFGSPLGRRDDTRLDSISSRLNQAILLKITPGQAQDGRSAADLFDTHSDGDVLLAATRIWMQFMSR